MAKNKSNGRHCVAYKKVKTEFGAVRRCSKFDTSEVDGDDASIDSTMHFRGFHSLNGALSASYRGQDLLIGAAAGLVGTLGVKWATNKFLAGKLPAIVTDNFPIFGAAATAAALYFGEKKSAQGAAHALGAIVAGGAVVGWSMLQKQFASLADVVSFQYDNYGRQYGVLQNDYQPMPTMAGYNGLIVDNTQRTLNHLAGLSMSDMDDDGAAALLGVN